MSFRGWTSCLLCSFTPTRCVSSPVNLFQDTTISEAQYIPDPATVLPPTELTANDFAKVSAAAGKNPTLAKWLDLSSQDSIDEKQHRELGDAISAILSPDGKPALVSRPPPADMAVVLDFRESTHFRWKFPKGPLKLRSRLVSPGIVDIEITALMPLAGSALSLEREPGSVKCVGKMHLKQTTLAVLVSLSRFIGRPEQIKANEEFLDQAVRKHVAIWVVNSHLPHSSRIILPHFFSTSYHKSHLCSLSYKKLVYVDLLTPWCSNKTSQYNATPYKLRRLKQTTSVPPRTTKRTAPAPLQQVVPDIEPFYYESLTAPSAPPSPGSSSLKRRNVSQAPPVQQQPQKVTFQVPQNPCCVDCKHTGVSLIGSTCILPVDHCKIDANSFLDLCIACVDAANVR